MLLPEFLVERDPLGGGAQWLGIQAATSHAPVLVSLHQAGLYQHAQVLLHSRQGHAVRPGQFAEGEFAAGQLRQDGAAGGVSQGAEGGVKGRAVILNHMV